MEVGIVSYGAYLPRYRITPQEIGRVWGTDGEQMSKNLLILSKSVPSPDEDVITISIEAARNMMRRCDVSPQDIGAIYVGSESHPYAVKPTGTVVAEAIGAGPNLTVADYEFACKAGTAAIQTCMGLVGSGMIKYGVAIGADTSQGAPGDALEFSASAGGAAYLIGSENVIARLNRTCSSRGPCAPSPPIPTLGKNSSSVVGLRSTSSSSPNHTDTARTSTTCEPRHLASGH